VDGLGTGHGEGDVGHEDLTLDELVDVFIRLGERDVIIDERGSQRLERAALLGASECRSEAVGLLDGDEMVGARFAVETGFDVAQPPGGAVEAGVGPIEEGVSQDRVARQCGRQRKEIVHVEARVPLVSISRSDDESRGATRATDGGAGEHAKRRRPPCHAREVADERPFDSLAALAVGRALPDLEGFVEVG